ncbi:FlgO family outer membrane protein [Dissulfuribacter thermophilus]|nr:FlgO family outer membrane protein [Dissulfuribacter thermophilus]
MVNTVPKGREVSNFPELCRELVRDLLKNNSYENLHERTLVVTTFSDINNLEHPTRFGRTLAETLLSTLTQNGIQVQEIRSATSINLAPQKGEFLLTRNPEEIKKSIKAETVLTGTFSETPTTVIVNARIIDFKTRTTISATSREIIKTPIVEQLLREEGGLEPSSLDRLIQ